MIAEHDNSDRVFQAGIVGVDLRDGTAKVGGRTGLRGFHDRMSARLRRR